MLHLIIVVTFSCTSKKNYIIGFNEMEGSVNVFERIKPSIMNQQKVINFTLLESALIDQYYYFNNNISNLEIKQEEVYITVKKSEKT